MMCVDVITLTTDGDRIRRAGETLRTLEAAGFREAQVARWFGVPLVTDVRYVPSVARWAPRRGIGGWIALLVGGETVDEGQLGVADAGPLVDAGLLSRDAGRLRAEVAILPVRGLHVLSDRIDAAGADAVVMIDLSALNLARSMPRLPSGAKVLDVGCGAGVLTLLAAKQGARAIGSDLDRRSLAMARCNAALNGLEAEFVESDLLRGVPPGPYALVTFNAPLLRAAVATSDPAAPSSYYTSDRGDALALEFLAEVGARLDDGGESLLQGQLTPAVYEALDERATELQIGSVRFADAPDGTPHAVILLRRGGTPFRRRAHVPLGPLCPVIDRRVVDALMGPRELGDGTTPLPAPWLELRESRQLVPAGAGGWRELRFGAHVIDDADLALLQKLDGRTLAQLALPDDERARLEKLVELASVILV
jgi:SAM-dependent methyltransferase